MPADEAIVLAGGRGTRLRSVVSDVPKPLAPVAGRPFLAWLLDMLADGGVRRVVLATGYLADQVQGAIGGRWRGMEVEHSVEPHALGTGGAIRLAARRLRGDSAHVLNGDTFLRYAPAALEAAAVESGTSIAVALARVAEVDRYGAVRVAQGKVVRFEEKGAEGAGLVNAGSYFLAAPALRALEAMGDGAFSFETGVLAPSAAAGGVAAFTDTADFIDIGVPADYLRARAIFAGR